MRRRFHRHGLPSCAKLVGGHLGESGPDPLAGLDLRSRQSHSSVGRDPQERPEDALVRAGPERASVTPRPCQECDNQPYASAAADQQGAARNAGQLHRLGSVLLLERDPVDLAGAEPRQRRF